MRRLLILLLVILVVLYGAADVYAKRFAQSKIEEQVMKRYPVAGEVDATVSVPLIFGLITGSKVDRVEVAINHVNAGEFFTDRVTAVFTGVHVKVGESISRRELVVDSIDRLDVTVEILEGEASRTLPSGFAFDFQDGRVSVTGPGGVSVEGEFEVREHEVRFVPVETVSIPGGFRSPIWNLTALPLASCLREIEIVPGRVRITCSVDSPPAEFPAEPS